MKPNGFVAAASMTSHTSIFMRSQSMASSFMRAMFTLRKMFSRSLVISATSGVLTGTTWSSALDHVVPVSTPEVAEMTKLLENIFRSVNIALMNELAMLCDRIDDFPHVDLHAVAEHG